MNDKNKLDFSAFMEAEIEELKKLETNEEQLEWIATYADKFRKEWNNENRNKK